MDPTPPSQGNAPVWQGDQAPCVYCGQVIGRNEERCPHCRTSMSPAVRRASRELIGPWYYLDPRNPSGRGVTFETLIKMIEKGRIRQDSIVRGPTTHQDWMFAAEAPRLAKYMGLCPHCFAEAKPEDTYCTRCQLNMNSRPAEPRPGIPADLVKEPVHKAAYAIESELAGSTKPSGETLEGEALDIPAAPVPPPAPPAAAPAPAARAEPTPVARPAQRVESAATLAAAAQLAAGSSPVGRAGAAEESPVAALSAITAERSRTGAKVQRRKLNIFSVLGMTWLTLGLLVVGFWYAWHAGWISHKTQENILKNAGVAPTASENATTTASANTAGTWLADRNKEVDNAVAVHDYAKAIEVCEAIRAKTGDPAWDARIEDLKRRQGDDRQSRRERLKGRLKSAENLALDRHYDDAVAILRSIPKEDRAFLTELGVGVDEMERRFREDQVKWEGEQQKEGQLKAAIARAQQLKTAKRNEEALAALNDIKRTYAADAIQKFIPTLDADIQGLEAAIAAAKPPIKIEPPPKVEVTPEQAAAQVADMMKQATDLEKAEKLKEALAKLEEVKRFDKKYWPDNLDERIKQVNAKIQALIFFGLGDTPPKKEKTKG